MMTHTHRVKFKEQLKSGTMIKAVMHLDVVLFKGDPTVILHCFTHVWRHVHPFLSQNSFPQIALATGVLTSSIRVRVRRYFWFVAGGLSGRVSSECVCVCLADFRSFWGGTVGQGLVGSVV